MAVASVSRATCAGMRGCTRAAKNPRAAPIWTRRAKAQKRRIIHRRHHHPSPARPKRLDAPSAHCRSRPRSGCHPICTREDQHRTLIRNTVSHTRLFDRRYLFAAPYAIHRITLYTMHRTSSTLSDPHSFAPLLHPAFYLFALRTTSHRTPYWHI